MPAEFAVQNKDGMLNAKLKGRERAFVTGSLPEIKMPMLTEAAVQIIVHA